MFDIRNVLVFYIFSTDVNGLAESIETNYFKTLYSFLNT